MTDELQWSDADLQAFWEYQAQFPEQFFTNIYGPGIVRSARQHIPPRSQPILDYGCGTGGLMNALLSRGHRVFGSDISLDSLKVVEKRFAGFPGFLGAGTPTSLLARGDTFGAIFCCEVVEHLSIPALGTVLADMKKLLSPGGSLIVTTPNREELAASQVYCPTCDHVFHRWQHVRSWSREDLSAILRGAGFWVESVRETNFGHALGPSGVLKRSLSTMLRRKKPHLLAVARAA